MKKTLLRLTLAAGLVGAVNLAMNIGNDAIAKNIDQTTSINLQVDDYEIVAPTHPNNGDDNLSSDEAQALCDGEGFTCATSESGQPDIEWDGNPSKF